MGRPRAASALTAGFPAEEGCTRQDISYVVLVVRNAHVKSQSAVTIALSMQYLFIHLEYKNQPLTKFPSSINPARISPPVSPVAPRRSTVCFAIAIQVKAGYSMRLLRIDDHRRCA
jgi:hypothetical protein